MSFLKVIGFGCAVLYFTISSCTYNNVDEIALKNWQYLNTSNSNLSSNNIYDIKLDSKGNIWVLCGGTLINYINKINPDLSIEVFEIPFSDSISPNFRSATAIALDKNDRLWVGARTSPFYCLENNQWHKFFINQNYSDVSSMGFDEYNNLWFSTYRGLFKYELDTTFFWGFDNSSIPSPEVTSILVKNSNEVYFFTIQTPPVIGSIASLSMFNGINFSVLDMNDKTYYSQMTLNGDNNLALLGKDKKIYEYKNYQFQEYKTDDFNCECKFHNPHGLIFDNETGYWIIIDNGLFNYNLKKLKYYNIDNSGINNSNLTSIIISNNKKMFIGTQDGGIIIFSNY